MIENNNSVHLQNFPDVSHLPNEVGLVENMDKVREICNIGLAIRNAENIRIRQPLKLVTIYGEEIAPEIENFKDIIADELNVKNVEFSNLNANIASKKLYIDRPKLGKRLGSKLKDIIIATNKNQWKEENGILEIAGEKLEDNEYKIILEAKVAKGAMPLTANDMLVVLDLKLDQLLINEGITRDLVRFIQNSRKEADLHVSNRINLSINCSEKLQNAFVENIDYVKEQVLAEEVSFNINTTKKFSFEGDIGSERIKISFSISQ